MRPSSSARQSTASGVRPKNRKMKDQPASIDSSSATGEVEELNFRIKDRQNPVGPKGFLDTIRETVVTRGAEKTIDVKETLKRPLTGLFRRRAPAAPPPPPGPPAQLSNQPNQNVPLQESNSMDAEPDSPELQRGTERQNSETMSMLNLKGMNGLGLDMSDFTAVDFGKFEDIDVSFLARLVCFEVDVTDDEEAWTWDSLFASVSTEIRNDAINNDESDEDETPPQTFGH
ncbi:unnamed protein product [Bursaphelenchus xylophilus]|uniref:(pine wood nematode) hypothetical protein n=1 Tax=Bursaphelenchus xylophilus TaxID=6326 RepID=A0A1I7RVZ2_BURXY|nr:unnamed protein product [Bursaphelenchus xylophilus]CAG9094905.1 unnamed protein product [Bursaphelenchus xylophilus]